jgi:DNA-binding winged helix-turn-helix (wHTH) protein/TolB-like protein/Flp pilus assembly protein TadD
MNIGENHIFEFGQFRLDETERMLSRNGEPLPLAPKVFDTLVVLVSHRGHLLEKNQLMEEVWPDTFVEEVNLAVNISTLRKVLGESDSGRPFIETVPKRGYRFIADVSEPSQASEVVIHNRVTARIVTSEQTDWLPADVDRNTDATARGRVRRRKLMVAALSGVAIVLALLAVPLWRITHGRTTTVAPPPIKSIAVLPFKPINSEANDEYLELGVADDLINRLSGLKEVVVRPTSTIRKYTNVNQDPIVVGRELKVDSVLEGNIQKLGDRVRITATLWSVSQGKQLWSNQFDENVQDMFAFEDSISERVAQAVIPQLSGEEKQFLARRHSERPQAHDAYLKGIYFWNKRTAEGLNKAISYFQQAIDQEPEFARAYSGMADSYVLLYDYNMLSPGEAVPRARAAAQKAIALDNTLAEPHSSLGYLETLYDWNWREAEKEFKTAIALSPNYATAHHWYGLHLAFAGRFNESLQELSKAQQLDPLSLAINSNLGRVLYFNRQFEPAIAQLKATVDLDPDFWGAHYKLAEAYAGAGRYQEAVTEYEKAFELSGDKSLAEAMSHGYAASGYRGAMQGWLEHLQENAGRGQTNAFGLAEVHASLGDNNLALNYLDQALRERTSWVVLINCDPKFDGLRHDPRFQELLRSEGLGQ